MNQRTSSTRLIGLGLAPILAISACQENEQSTTSTTGEPRTLSQAEFISAFQELSCQNLERCCTVSNYAFDSSVCPNVFANAGQGTERSIYNAGSGTECILDLAASAECNLASTAPSCAGVYRGASMPGESCATTLDCRQPTNGNSTCDAFRGICIGGYRGKLDIPCQQSCESYADGSVICAWGPVSGESATGTVVVNCFANDGLACGRSGRCEALAEVGQPCTDDSSCNRALYCAISASGTATCQRRGELGFPCVDFTAPCVASAYCSAGTCVARKADGQRCFSNAECLGVCNCGLGGDCATAGVCADPDALAQGLVQTLVTATYCVVGSTL